MFQVVKRDGEVDEFKIGKITAAIHKAFDAKEKNYSEEMIDLLGLRVTSDFQKKITDNKITVEEIQDSVENVLIQAGYADVAKAYILYRKQREKVRNMKSTILDYKEIVNSYVGCSDTDGDTDSAYHAYEPDWNPGYECARGSTAGSPAHPDLCL